MLRRVKRRPRRRATEVPEAPPVVGVRPLVAIVGRPNVGKSTLFNRLVGRRAAIVEDVPGVTRDRNYADAELLGREVTLVDTGGFEAEAVDAIKAGIRVGVEIAIEEADVIVCLFDGIEGLVPGDEEAVELLRRSGKGRSVVWAANKIDTLAKADLVTDLYRLGIDRVIPISAQHGRGVADLVDAIIEALPPPPTAVAGEAEEQARVLRVAVVGRPNAGKSSICNRILGTERLLVDERPGTTRDAIDSAFEWEGQRIVLVDTAGIRRQKSVDRGVERHAVFAAIRALDRADVAVLVIDAAAGAAEQDAKILGLAMERGLGVVLTLNKWDLVRGDDAKRPLRETREKLSFAPWAPIVRVSAKTGRGARSLLETIRRVHEARTTRISTGQLNRFFAKAIETHAPPMAGGRAVRLYYITQPSAAPPTFVVSANYPADVHFSYRRYVENRLREAFGFEGTPIVVHYKARGRG
ncbi:MAG: ribosome biogenesis GTPase Der [Deltaproteobacteria bacterium]|nr:ribosome biogenesis GTPase Der [Deltaproteobacteria bacterium]